ncbi:MAG: hypothetical protein WCJ61_09025 [Paludibacter sp.]
MKKTTLKQLYIRIENTLNIYGIDTLNGKLMVNVELEKDFNSEVPEYQYVIRFTPKKEENTNYIFAYGLSITELIISFEKHVREFYNIKDVPTDIIIN